MASTFNHFNASEQILFGSITTPLIALGAITSENLGIAASVIIQDITYTAVNGGVGGNSITIQYIEDGIAGLETVNVSGTAIVIHIGNHTVLGSTATQVRTALLLSPAAVLLVVPVISGTASNIQLAVSTTPLMGGATGGSSIYVSSIHADSSSNLTGAVQLVSGTHVTLSQVGQAITINATGELSQTLTNSHIFVGNVSNVATDVAMSGDANISNTGVLTLVNTSVTPGSYTSANITVDSKGRITSASSGGSGANTTLSNLISPTAINQDILPVSDGSRSLGSSSLQFEQLYTYNVISNNDDLDLTSAFNVYLASGTGFDIILNPGSGNINADTHNITNMADPVNPQDAVTKNYVSTNFLMLTGGTMSGNIDMGQHQLLNAVIQTGSTEPVSPVEGQIFYNTTTHQAELWNGTSWVIMG